MSTMALEAQRPERPVWKLAVESFVPLERRARVRRWTDRLPLALVALLQLVCTLRLRDGAYEDEALYIDAGHAYLAHWLHGAAMPTPSYGSYFSGAPWAYPVVAGALDAVGGLELVRVFSALLLVLAMLCVAATVRSLWGERCGLFAALAFAASAPVLLVGDFATYDAPTLAALAGALWLGVARRSWRSAVAAGVLLALAPVFKYTGAVFVPVVLAVVVLSRAHRLGRALLAAVVAGALLAVGWVVAGHGLRAGLLVTTASRTAEDPQSAAWMAHYAALDVGVLAALAVLGAVTAVTGLRSVRSAALVLALLGGGVLLQVAVLRIGEGASFEKHLAFSTLFLAPLAGRGMLWLSRRSMGVVWVSAAVTLLVLVGLSRSHAMYQWADVAPVRQVVAADPVPGQYLSTSFEALEYYTRDDPGVVWADPYAVEGSSDAAIRQAVADGTWQVVALRSSGNDNASLARRNAVLLQAFAASPRYELVLRTPVQKGSVDDWLVYRLR